MQVIDGCLILYSRKLIAVTCRLFDKGAKIMLKTLGAKTLLSLLLGTTAITTATYGASQLLKEEAEALEPTQEVVEAVSITPSLQTEEQEIKEEVNQEETQALERAIEPITENNLSEEKEESEPIIPESNGQAVANQEKPKPSSNTQKSTISSEKPKNHSTATVQEVKPKAKTNSTPSSPSKTENNVKPEVKQEIKQEVKPTESQPKPSNETPKAETSKPVVTEQPSTPNQDEEILTIPMAPSDPPESFDGGSLPVEDVYLFDPVNHP